jgi:branched-chain amino acid aminotransferase
MLLAPDLGLEAREQTLTRYDLLAADEVFLTGTGAGVVRVSSIDGISVGQGPSHSVLPSLCEALDTYAMDHGVPIPGLGKAA